MRFNPDGTASIKMYDAKFADGPKSLSEAKIASWMKETRAAVDAMRPGPLKDAALQALKTGRVEGEIYIYNK